MRKSMRESADTALVTSITAPRVRGPVRRRQVWSPVTADMAPVTAVKAVTAVTTDLVVRSSEGGAGHVSHDGFGGAGVRPESRSRRSRCRSR